MWCVSSLHCGHEVAYWSGSDLTSSEELEFPHTMSHSHPDALEGVPASALKEALIPPPDPALIRACLGCESKTLTMMNKLFEGTQTSERKHRYYQMLAYWNFVLEKFRPDAIIFPTIPHTVYDFVLYELSKYHSVRTILFEPTWVGDRMVVMTDYKAGPIGFPAEMTALSPVAVGKDVEKECERQTRTPSENVYVQTIKKRFSGISALKMKARLLYTTVTVHRDLSVFMKIVTYFPRRLGANKKLSIKACKSYLILKGSIYICRCTISRKETAPRKAVSLSIKSCLRVLYRPYCPMAGSCT